MAPDSYAESADVARCRETGRRRSQADPFSNTNALYTPWILKNYAISEQFDAGVDSFEFGEIKPQEAINQYAIRTYGRLPKESSYIDNLAANVSASARIATIPLITPRSRTG